MLKDAFIPYAGYYSSPFVRWQGSLSGENSIIMGANTAKRWIKEKNWEPGIFDYLILGTTITQPFNFYGSPWVAAMLGMGGGDDSVDASAMMISQACTTSVTCIYQAAMGIENKLYENVFTLATDRCSNSPHSIWPNPRGTGGQVESENLFLDMINKDPWAGDAMIVTAESTAKEIGATKDECDEVTLRRYEQYLQSLENERAFQKRYMFPVEIKKSRKDTTLLGKDEGITKCTKEGLEKLQPVIKDGVHTFGSQTHPADGNCGVVVTTRENAKRLSTDPKIEIQVISYGYARAKKGYMAQAPVPAMKNALENADLTIGDIKTIKAHNPFAINDIYLAKEMGIDVMSFNNYGSSMIFGHPNGPTAARCIIEGIEEVVTLGGGYMLFTSCAAGDCGASIILKIG